MVPANKPAGVRGPSLNLRGPSPNIRNPSTNVRGPSPNAGLTTTTNAGFATATNAATARKVWQPAPGIAAVESKQQMERHSLNLNTSQSRSQNNWRKSN
jgi:hypothetical protein